MLTWPSVQRGMSLAELMIAVAIISLLMALAAPSFRSWTQNSKIRGTAEAILNGLQLAKSEAVRRNSTIRFQLVSNMTNACTLGAAGNTASWANWVVSYDNPVSLCASPLLDDANDPGTSPAPRIIQVKRSTDDGSGKVVVAAGIASTTGLAAISFNGLGRVSPVMANDYIVCTGIETSPAVGISGVAGAARCVTSTNERRMQITVTPGGQVRMCDPLRNLPDPAGC